MTELDTLQKALENTEGKIPEEVFDTFFPKNKEIAGEPLVDITLGHTMLLSQFKHPLSKGELDNWQPHDIALALYVFTRSAKELREQIKDESFEDKMIEFIEQIPADEIRKSAFIIIQHYMNTSSKSIQMEDKDKSSGKKKETKIPLVQKFLSLVQLLKSIISHLKRLFSKSR